MTPARAIVRGCGWVAVLACVTFVGCVRLARLLGVPAPIVDAIEAADNGASTHPDPVTRAQFARLSKRLRDADARHRREIAEMRHELDALEVSRDAGAPDAPGDG